MSGANGLPRRVAMAPSAYWPSLGGVEELVRQLAHEQQARGGSPLVLTMRWPVHLPAAEVVEGVPVRRFVYRSPDGPLRHAAVGAATLPPNLARTVAALRSHHADLVHVQCVSQSAWYAGRAARLLGLPLVVTLQGELTMDATQVYERSPFVRRTLRWLLEHADAVTACSKATLHEAIAWSGLELGSRATIVPNGVRAAELDEGRSHRHERPYAFALGRLVDEKGFDVLLDAFALLVAIDDPGVDLLLAGEGPQRAALLAQVDRLGLTDRVQLVGRADRAQVGELLRGAEVVVVPSRHEPFGIVNLEAMAAGRPVVATAVGGVPEVVEDGASGLVVPPADAGALAAAVRRVLGDAVLAERLGRGGRRRAAAFEWAVVTDRYEEVYRRAAAPSADRPGPAPGSQDLAGGGAAA